MASENSQLNVENLVLMWADASVNSNKENLQAQATLTKTHNRLKKFPSVTDCEQAIQQLSETDRVILIVSGSFGKELIPRVHELEQVLTIYIFCMDQARYLEWARDYKKIKSVVVDLDRLISIIQADHEQRVNMKKALHINIPNPTSKTDNQISHTTSKTDAFRYSFKYFVNAGELQYTDKSMNDFAAEIVNRSKEDFNILISETVQPLMYLLKREQNLMDFISPFKRLLAKEKKIPCISQRLLIDTIMINSDRILSRRLTSLLSKRNPVPMIQPRLESAGDKYRSISNLIHVWDYHRPVFFSFGIGQCKGKTSLINKLFSSNFELPMKDTYFSGTIDIDFGYHFVDRRPINIANAHGEISRETLGEIAMLFTGFLVHVDSNYFYSNQSNVTEYLKLLPSQNEILLLIRDVVDEDDEQVQSDVEYVRSACPHCQIYHWATNSEENNDENKEKIDKIRDRVFDNTRQRQCLDEQSMRQHLQTLLNDTEKEALEQDIAFNDSIRSVLINGGKENYLLYSLFTDLCKMRLEVAKIDPYQKHFRSEQLYKLNLDLFKADSEFKQQLGMGPRMYGTGFELFVNLLRKEESRLNELYLLSFELRKKASEKKTSQKNLSFYDQLSLEIHWRNAIIGSIYLSDNEQNMLIQSYRDYIDEGNPFEIVDGDNFEIQSNFLAKVFGLFPNKKIFVISIIGPQNSGKSTLLNFLFGTLFEARDGRCTKGIYGTLINVQNKICNNDLVPVDYDYILVIDTEGLLSIQKSDEQYDKRIILFCLAVSHLILVNVEGEINDPVKNFLVLCIQTLKYLDETNFERPKVHFVFNKRTDRNEKYCEELFEHVYTTLKDNDLQNEIHLEQKNIHILSTASNKQLSEILNGRCAPLSTDINFVTDVQKLCKAIIDEIRKTVQQAGNRFCIPTNWIELANRVLQTIKKHPNLTHFKDVFERKQYDQIRDGIRKDFDQYLSPAVARYLMSKEKENGTDCIKNFFQVEYKRILNSLEDRLQDHCQQCSASGNVQERSLGFIQVQLTSILRSWEVSAIMAAERHKIDQTRDEIKNKLRAKAITVTHKNSLMNRQSAMKMFEEELKDVFFQIETNFNSELVWKQSIEMVSLLCDVLDKVSLPSGGDILVYLPFLQALDVSSNQPTSMEDCLSKIHHKFQSDASNIYPLASCLTNLSSVISQNEIAGSYEFLSKYELSRIYQGMSSDGNRTRAATRISARQSYSQLFENNWKTIVQISKCFDVLLKNMKEVLISKKPDESTTEITLIQEILGAVKKVTQDFNKELNIFNFCLSKEFIGTLYIYAIISTASYYYHRQKTNFLHVIWDARENKSKSIEQFLPWVVLSENDDKNIAVNLTNDLCQELCQSTESKIKDMIEDDVNEQMRTLNRASIIKQLDGEVYEASDDWLQRYVLKPNDMIIERFDDKWKNIKTRLDAKLALTMDLDSTRLSETYQFIKEVNTCLEKDGAHSLSFVDNLFQLKDKQNTGRTNDKQFCMANLLYLYLVNKEDPTEITTRNGLIYTVDARWKTIIENFPKPSVEIENVFRSLQNTFEMSTISYLGVFLEEILEHQNETKAKTSKRINSFIQKTYLSIKERFSKQIQGCQALCPCCKRICDFDHHLNMTSSIGHEENRHRCQFGHQIRAMGGVRYEITNEASMSWCEMMGDNDVIITRNNTRQTWKDFKNANNDWDFIGDLRVRERLETPDAYIWKKIGQKLCDHFGGMKFVMTNSPLPVNHFIFVLDHSGSMNERTKKVTPSKTFSDQANINAWEHLLRAVKGFVDLRIRQVSLNDRITIIVFASRAERIFIREKVTDIDINRINTPMDVYGHQTNFSVAFQMVIKTLEEVKNDSNLNNLRQTIIFMTDGEPQGYPEAEIQLLKGYRSDQNNRASINNFWTMALGKFNRQVIEKINQELQGKLVDTEKPEDLVDAYAQIAEIL